jgi:hypothetical protein
MAVQRSTGASEQRGDEFSSSDAEAASTSPQPRKGRFARGERGAALVEMAMILPVIILLLFGVIEMSWLFAQANDVRHGAREGARLAAVNFGDTTAIGTEVCNRMDLADGNLIITFADASAGIDDGARSSVGRIQVTLSPSTLTGMFDGLVGGGTVTSDIDFVLEQPITPEAAWWNDGAGGSHTCA